MLREKKKYNSNLRLIILNSTSFNNVNVSNHILIVNIFSPGAENIAIFLIIIKGDHMKIIKELHSVTN